MSGGPIPNSHWVVPGRLAAGEYPGAVDADKARATVRRLLTAGTRRFLDLDRGRGVGAVRWRPPGRGSAAWRRGPLAAPADSRCVGSQPGAHGTDPGGGTPAASSLRAGAPGPAATPLRHVATAPAGLPSMVSAVVQSTVGRTAPGPSGPPLSRLDCRQVTQRSAQQAASGRDVESNFASCERSALRRLPGCGAGRR